MLDEVLKAFAQTNLALAAAGKGIFEVKERRCLVLLDYIERHGRVFKDAEMLLEMTRESQF